MKNGFARIIRALAALAAVFSLTAIVSPVHGGEERAKLKIVASLFPQYDFARRIAGEKADVSLILPPGAESHSFEPTPGDMRDIASADLFIFTGEHMEPWAKRLADAASSPGGVTIVDAAEGVALVKNPGTGDADGHERDSHDHDGEHDGEHDAGHEQEDEHEDGEHEQHGGEADHGDDDHEHEHAHGDGHYHLFDPHIWLSPPLAEKMAENIAAALSKRDPANAGFYETNARGLLGEIRGLDAWFSGVVASSPRRLLVFGERFAFGYFVTQYGLDMAGPYKDCAPGVEPGMQAVIGTIEAVRRDKVRFIYLDDMATDRISRLIRNETGVEILRVESLHNPAAARQNAGESYVSIMRANMAAFAKGLE
ncbi:MAG: metal ABC transporter substrate-binding protein [Planctomycetota bacterium]|jgi:zinc transport system substrate-binding protein|nr:metal ABC transporter substrate-binding protein [Planctomycetota bacterium]